MSPRLLLVDDEDAIRTIAQLSLERVGGWTVIPAASGQSALQAAHEQGPFDAVLLDVMMPDLDGPTTLARLRAGPLDPRTPSSSSPPRSPPPTVTACAPSAPPARSPSPSIP